jgi:HD-GYP domain-containing protein (c-di-GMP phosphodiesterase class II)
MRFSDLNKIKAAAAPQAKPAPQVKPAPQPAPAPQPEAPETPRPLPALPPTTEQAASAGQQPSLTRRRRELEKSTAPKELPFHELEPRAKEVYSRLLLQVDSFLKAVDEPYCEKYEAALAACALAAGELKANPYFLGCSVYSTADDYLRAHTANTVILALAMGLEAGLDGGELGLLGFCSLAHDIGMTGYSALYNRQERLTEEELEEMTLHAEAGAAKLDRIVDLDYKVKDRAKKVILQIHERADGSGYPDRLSNEDIDPLAQLISIADAYEAMTHPRSWREALPPPDAVKELIAREGGGFNAGAVKLLISVISMYPPGSLVELSTGETAQVLRVNRGLLTRPVVQILLNKDGGQAEPRMDDLKQHPLVSIERTVTQRKLGELNPKYAARLELARWWTDW